LDCAFEICEWTGIQTDNTDTLIAILRIQTVGEVIMAELSTFRPSLVITVNFSNTAGSAYICCFGIRDLEFCVVGMTVKLRVTLVKKYDPT